MNEKENEKVTRRKFLEDSSRKALGGTAAAFLGLSMIEPKTVHAAHCWWNCSGDCEGCTGSCGGGCTTSCTGECSSACTGSCDSECLAGCQSGCLADCLAGCLSGCDDGCVIGVGFSAQAEHGTPVAEREVSTRHFTV